MALMAKYQTLGNEDAEKTLESAPPQPNTITNLSQTLRNSLAFLLGVLLATTTHALFISVPTASLSDTYLQRQGAIIRVTSCGKSVAEAKQRGCVYDPALLYWTRPYCQAEDIADEFIRNPVHEVFFDKEKLHPLNLTYVRTGEFGEAYDRVEHHKGHCINSWKVLTQAATRFGPQTPELLLPGMAVEWGHTVHCSDDVVVPNEDSRWRSKPFVKFWPGINGCYLLRAPELPDLY